MASNFIQEEMNENFSQFPQQPRTVEEYAKEIAAALQRAKNGEIINVEELEEEMKQW